MKKIKLSVIVLIFFSVLIIGLKEVYGADDLDDATITVNENKLPVEFLIGTEEEINLLNFFTVRDNGKRIDLSELEEDFDYFLIHNFDINVAGIYKIELIYFGMNEKTVDSEITLKVILEDLEEPEFVKDDSGNLIIKDSYNLEVKRESSFNSFYLNFKAKDNIDGEMSLTSNDDLIGMDQVNINKLGSHDIEVVFTDSSGNVLSKTIVLNIVDNTPPKITYQRLFVTKKGKVVNYNDEIIIEDNYDDYDVLTITYQFELDGNPIDAIDYNKAGEYRVIITATDLSNNSQIESFRIIVEDGFGLGMFILIINGALIAIAGITIGILYALRKKKV